MKKALTISLIPVLVFFIFGAFTFVDAQTSPTEQCTIVRNIKTSLNVATNENILIIHEDSLVSASVTDMLGTEESDVSKRNIFITDDAKGATKEAATPAQQIKIAKDWGTVCLLNTINTVVDWIFIFLIAISVALIAIAGFIYMTTGASPEKQKLAGKMIMGAVIGIVIAILARVLPALITGILV